jgi:tocopherol O-methyltransferase
LILPNRAQHPKDVADHYDELDPVYRAIWGEHVHHGLWRSGRETATEAVEALSDHVGARLGLDSGAPPHSLIDIGCGYGATARRFAARHDARVIGYTLSREQAGQAGSSQGVDICVGDWLHNDLPDDSADGAYAIESSEHMADKPGFFAQAFRVLKPGGRLVVCAWLADEDAGPWAIRHLLEPICREGRLASMGTRGEYAQWAGQAGFILQSYEDVSRQVRRTWSICAGRFTRRLLTDPAYMRLVASPRTRNRIFVLSLPRLILAYRIGAMRYGVFAFDKPVQGTIALGSGRGPAASNSAI